MRLRIDANEPGRTATSTEAVRNARTAPVSAHSRQRGRTPGRPAISAEQLEVTKSGLTLSFPRYFGGIAPPAGQLVSPTRLRFISKKRTGSLPGAIRSPVS